MSRSAPTELSLWKCPPNPFWYASPWMRTTIGFWNWRFEKKDSEHASPRSWSSALCRYARYWISGTGSSPDTLAPSARPRIDVSSSRVSKTRAAPNRSRSPFVTPYTPPFCATSSPKTTICGYARSASASAALMVWASVSGPAYSGSRPLNTAIRVGGGGAASGSRRSGSSAGRGSSTGGSSTDGSATEGSSSAGSSAEGSSSAGSSSDRSSSAGSSTDSTDSTDSTESTDSTDGDGHSSSSSEGAGGAGGSAPTANS